MMSKMVKFLPIMMFFIMLSLPGALGLYYVTSNIFAAIQQHFLLKRDAEEMDKIADMLAKKPGKKATAKARAREAREADVTTTPKAKNTSSEERVTRITAKDTLRKGEK